MKKKGENKSQILKITFHYSACGSLHCQHLLLERDSTFRSQISDFVSAAHGQPDTSTQWTAFTHSCFGLNPHHQTVKKLNCSGERLLIYLPFFFVHCSLFIVPNECLFRWLLSSPSSWSPTPHSQHHFVPHNLPFVLFSAEPESYSFWTSASMEFASSWPTSCAFCNL